jgi:hypothetical protein
MYGCFGALFVVAAVFAYVPQQEPPQEQPPADEWGEQVSSIIRLYFPAFFLMFEDIVSI